MKWGRTILIIFGALAVTALGIDAADTVSGVKGTLLSQVIQRGEGVCPQGMVEVSTIPGITCVDAYEASAGEKCPEKDPGQMIATQQNMGETECASESRQGVSPWRFVTRDQAMQLCARSGKRLPTSDEWYQISLGMVTPESRCNVSSKQMRPTGSLADCKSPSGVYDLVGNAWEWVSDDVINGMYKATHVPSTGYVAQVDSGGMATMVSEIPQDLFEKDYFWSRADGAYGIIRGGYYDSGSDGGVYIIHADTPPTTAGTGIGFRCVK